MSDNLLAATLCVGLPVMIVLIINLTRYFIHRDKMKIIKTAITNHVEMTPEMMASLTPAPRKENPFALLIWAVILIAVGLGLGVGLITLTAMPGPALISGGIPLLVGIGLTIVFIIKRRSERE